MFEFVATGDGLSSARETKARVGHGHTWHVLVPGTGEQCGDLRSGDLDSGIKYALWFRFALFRLGNLGFGLLGMSYGFVQRKVNVWFDER